MLGKRIAENPWIILSLMSMFFITILCPPVRALELKGNIDQHEFRLGEEFNERYVPAGGTDSIWAPIPTEIAGTWHCDFEFDIQDTPSGPVTVKRANHQTYTFGEQMDNQGTIWDYMPAPEVRRADTGRTITIFISRSRTFTRQPVGVIYKTERVMVNKLANKVIMVDQSEQRITLYPGQPQRGMMHQECLASSSLKMNLDRSMADNQLVAPYHRIDTGFGLNLHEDFKAWLGSHGLGYLDPDRPAQQ
jgi:hypothetical protein